MARPATPDPELAPSARQSSLAGESGVDFLAVVVVLLVGAAVSGLLLAPGYRPVPELAANDLYDLREASPLAFVAKLHYWLGQLAVLVAWLYLLQAVVRGVYRGSRRVWYFVLLLAAAVVALATSGRMLVWDDAGRRLATSFGSGGGAPALAWAWWLHASLLPLLTVLILLALRSCRRGEPGEEG